MSTCTTLENQRPNPLYRLAMVVPYVVTAALLAILIYCHIRGAPFNVSGEDGLVEWSTCVSFGVMAVVAAAAAIVRWRELSRPGKVVLIAVAIVCLLAVGEELSWGERIFGFKPPASMEDKSAAVRFGHGDVAVHNLTFHFGKLQFSIGGVLFGPVLLVCLAMHGIVLPIGYKAGRPWAKRLVDRWGIFIGPVHLGILVTAAATLFHYHQLWRHTDAREYKEMIVPTIYIFILLHYYFRTRRVSGAAVTVLALVLLAAGFAASTYAGMQGREPKGRKGEVSSTSTRPGPAASSAPSQPSRTTAAP